MTSPFVPAPAVPAGSSGGLHSHTAWKWVVRIGLIGALLSVIAVVAWRLATSRSAPTVRYETAAIDRGAIDAKVTANGTLSAIVTVSVGSQVSGRIDSLGADFESAVTKGQVIATIEPQLFRAAVDQARANYLAAKAAVEKARATEVNAVKQFERAKMLLQENLLSFQDYDSADAARRVAAADVAANQAGVAQAAAALSQAELNLHYTTIVSPIDGIVISRNVDVGQTVAAAFQAPTLFTIAQDLTKMQVDTNVAEADVGRMRADDERHLHGRRLPGRELPGRVRQVRDSRKLSRTSSPTTRSSTSTTRSASSSRG